MAKPKVRTGTIVITLVVVAFLALLFNHLLNFDYKVEPLGADSGSQPGMLQPELNIEDDGRRNVKLRFSIVNVSKSNLRVVDSRYLSPLYVVKMLVKRENGTFEPCNQSTMNMARQRQESLDKTTINRDALLISELLPTSGYSRTIPLSDLFEFEKSGTYSVSVTYQPDALAKGAEPDVAGMNFYSQHLSCSTVFDWPPKKPAPPATPPNVVPTNTAVPKPPPEKAPPSNLKIEVNPVGAPEN